MDRKPVVRRSKPAFHLLLLLVILTTTALGYVAIIWSGELRGYGPGIAVAARDLALFIPIIGAFIWLVRRQKYRGECSLFTVAVFLFSIGALMQYRLFSDPEYGARGSERFKARRLKAQTVRLQNISTAYDDEKKASLFGSANAIPQRPSPDIALTEHSLADLMVSVNTYIPLGALAVFALCFSIFRRDDLLLWLQRHSATIGIATLAPFALVVLIFSDEGKFLGQTTPWEPVKILFLLSFAGALAEGHRRLARTRWGLPAFRYLVPFLVIATMPLLPFFALADFGQMLVFLAVYVTLYIVAVGKRAQLIYGLMFLVVAFGGLFVVSNLSQGSGIPPRVYLRFQMWTDPWRPPAPDTWWWKRDYERYLREKRLTVGPADSREIAIRNSEAWSDRVTQLTQGLFGINSGGVAGTGYGLGYPETVPVSDSDFVYAAVSEETGFLGGITLLVGVAIFVLGGTAISLGAADLFTKLLATGFTAFMGFQALVNVGGVLKALPMTGITLPFVSHGGWSLITSFGMLGILLAISHRNAVIATRSDDAIRDSKNVP